MFFCNGDGNNVQNADESAQYFNSFDVLSIHLQEELLATNSSARSLSGSITSLNSVSQFICDPNSLKKENVVIHWKHLLVNTLLELHQPEAEIQQGIDHIRHYYSAEPKFLKQINNFQEKYFQPERENGPICWFTSGDFLSKFLQRALQTKNMNQLFPLRFFIRDLYQHLKRVQGDGSDHDSLAVYRSVVPTQDYRHRVNELITMNSFFSTSMSHNLAVIFAESQSILYEIHTGLKENTDLVYANLSQLNDDANSSSPPPLEQQEVLFALYTPFRIDDVKMEEVPSRVVLHLLDRDDLAGISAEVTQQFKGASCETEKLLECGKYWEERNETDKAVNYYKKLFTILLSDEKERIETICGKLERLYSEDQETYLSSNNNDSLVAPSQLVTQITDNDD